MSPEPAWTCSIWQNEPSRSCPKHGAWGGPSFETVPLASATAEEWAEIFANPGMIRCEEITPRRVPETIPMKPLCFGRPRKTGFFEGGKRRLRCHWCGGKHKSNECMNRDGQIVKLYGTTDPKTGSYVPPRGVKVRVLSIPPTVHSDKLREILKGQR